MYFDPRTRSETVSTLHNASQILDPRPGGLAAQLWPELGEKGQANLRAQSSTDLLALANALREHAKHLEGVARMVETVDPGSQPAVAAYLRAFGALFCDHCRLNGDGTCRYCDTPHSPEERTIWEGTYGQAHK